MDAADLLRSIVRSVHVLSGAAWVGGSLFYLVVLTASLRATLPPEASATINRAFGALVQVCIWLLLASGGILTFDRLAQPQAASGLYVVVLGVKVALSVAMFVFAGWLGERAWRRRRPAKARAEAERKHWPGWLSNRSFVSRLILALGVIVFVLGAVLTMLFETGLRRGGL